MNSMLSLLDKLLDHIVEIIYRNDKLSSGKETLLAYEFNQLYSFNKSTIALLCFEKLCNAS